MATLLLAAGCMATAPLPATGNYLGQESGKSLVIGGGRMAYTGDYGDTRIASPAPVPQPTINGHSYEARGGGHSLAADVTHNVLLHLALAIGSGSEGATHSHARRAMTEGFPLPRSNMLRCLA